MAQNSERAERCGASSKRPLSRRRLLQNLHLRPRRSAGCRRLAPRRCSSFLSRSPEVCITKLIPAGHGAEGWLAEAGFSCRILEVKTDLPATQETRTRTLRAELDADLRSKSTRTRPDDQ